MVQSYEKKLNWPNKLTIIYKKRSEYSPILTSINLKRFFSLNTQNVPHSLWMVSILCKDIKINLKTKYKYYGFTFFSHLRQKYLIYRKYRHIFYTQHILFQSLGGVLFFPTKDRKEGHYRFSANPL